MHRAFIGFANFIVVSVSFLIPTFTDLFRTHFRVYHKKSLCFIEGVFFALVETLFTAFPWFSESE